MYNTLPPSVTVCLAHLKEKEKKSALLLQYRSVWETTRNKTGKEYICMLIWHIYLYSSWCHVKIKEWNLSTCFILQIKGCALEDTLLCIKTELNTPSMLVHAFSLSSWEEKEWGSLFQANLPCKSEFQDSQGYQDKPCLNKQTN